jgi:hypothetical protein
MTERKRYFFSMFQNTGIGLVTMPLRRSARVAVGRVYWPRWMCVPYCTARACRRGGENGDGG